MNYSKPILSIVFFFVIFFSFYPITIFAQTPTFKWQANADVEFGIVPISKDVNGDGVYEIFGVGWKHSNTSTARAVAINGSNGNIIWSKEWSHGYVDPHMPSAIGDLDNDGTYELVIADMDKTLALNAEDGTVFWWVNNASHWSQLAIADVDNNGYPYVYTANNGDDGNGMKILKLRGIDGSIAASHSVGGACYGGVSIADLEGDGEYEILVGGGPGSGIQCFDENLNLKWQVAGMQTSSNAPMIADVNKDGILDVVVMYQSNPFEYTGGICVIDGSTGQAMPGRCVSNLGLAAHMQPAVHDIDKDGNLELITSYGTYPQVWDLYSWSLDHTFDERCSEPPDFANVMGNSDLEIIAGCAWVDDSAEIFDSSYNLLYEVPNAFGASLVQDIDNDGLNELMFSAGGNYSWIKAFDTSAQAPNPAVRTDNNYYSERRLAAGIYIPPIGGGSPPPPPQNQPPVLDPIGNKIVNEGQLLQFTITATDPNGDNLTYSASNLPSGSSFNQNTHVFTWTPSYSQSGNYSNVCFQVSDGTLTDSECIAITVNDVSQQLSISFVSPTPANGAVINQNQVTIAASVSNVGSSSSFINWNQSLIGYWNFNQNSGQTAQDQSSYGNNCILTNGSSWVTGKLGSAVHFDGVNDYLNCGNSANFNLTNKLTIEAWVKYSSMSDFTRIVGKDRSTAYSLRISGAGKIELAGKFGGVMQGNNLFSTIGAPSGQWAHVAATYDGQIIRYYINGQTAGTAAPNPAGSLSTNNSPLYIGAESPSNNYPFPGDIDEVRVWNRVLSGQEIKASYDTNLYSLSNNFTDLPNGTYQYYAKTTNVPGETAQTETRTLTITGGGAPQNIYYVAKNGSDSNPGTEVLPWLTIQKAANVLVAGDTVYVKQGTYNERVTPLGSGTPGNYITYAAYPGNTVIIDGTGLTGWPRGLFYIADKSYIKVSGFKITNVSSTNLSLINAIAISNSHHITLEKNYTYKTSASGIWAGVSNNIIIDNNEVELAHGFGEPYSEEALTLYNVNTFEVKNNHVHNCNHIGIDIKHDSSNGSVYNNHVHNVSDGPIYIDHATSVDIYQNNLHDNTGCGIAVAVEPYDWTNIHVIKDINVYNNLVYNNGGGFCSWLNPSGTVIRKNIKVINNTFYNNSNCGFRISENLVFDNFVIRNNIVSQNGNQQLLIRGATNLIDHNLVYGSYTEVVGNDAILVSPQFVNQSGGDLHLSASSPAIDRASSIGAPSLDFDGNSRPKGSGFDVGTFESQYTNSSANQFPILGLIGNKTVNEGQLLQFTVSTTDPNGGSLIHSASNLPGGATFNVATHIFNWTPSSVQSGIYKSVCFRVFDNELADEECITITVNDVSQNQPPVLDSIGNKTVNEGSALQFTITASDPNGDNLTYSASNLPPGAIFNAATHAFSWTPSYTQSGTYSNVCFQVSDGTFTDSECITITVNDSSQPCTNCSLGTPTVNPASPQQNQSFTITCPANAFGYDCITAYSNNNSCTYSSWSGSNVIFNCSGQTGGGYTAKCKSSPGTQSNCCSQEKTQSFTVQTPYIPPSPPSGGGGGGTGGGGYVFPSQPSTTTPMTIEQLKARLAQLLALLAQLQAQLAQLRGETIPSNYQFTKDLNLNQKDNDVKYLQIFLKNQGKDIYPEGLVTGYYGKLTYSALKNFQLKQGVITSVSDSETGIFKLKTRNKVNEMMKK